MPFLCHTCIKLPYVSFQGRFQYLYKRQILFLVSFRNRVLCVVFYIKVKNALDNLTIVTRCDKAIIRFGDELQGHNPLFLKLVSIVLNNKPITERLLLVICNITSYDDHTHPILFIKLNPIVSKETCNRYKVLAMVILRSLKLCCPLHNFEQFYSIDSFNIVYLNLIIVNLEIA